MDFGWMYGWQGLDRGHPNCRSKWCDQAVEEQGYSIAEGLCVYTFIVPVLWYELCVVESSS